MVGNSLKMCLEEIDLRSPPAPVLSSGWWRVLSLVGQRTLEDCAADTALTVSLAPLPLNLTVNVQGFLVWNNGLCCGWCKCVFSRSL